MVLPNVLMAIGRSRRRCPTIKVEAFGKHEIGVLDLEPMVAAIIAIAL